MLLLADILPEEYGNVHVSPFFIKILLPPVARAVTAERVDTFCTAAPVGHPLDPATGSVPLATQMVLVVAKTVLGSVTVILVVVDTVEVPSKAVIVTV